MATHLAISSSTTAKSDYPACTGVLMLIEKEDEAYVHRTKSAFHSTRVKVLNTTVTTITELAMAALAHKFSHVVTTRLDILQKLLPDNLKKQAKISNYAGSLFTWDTPKGSIEILIVNPLKQLVTVTYGEFLFKHYVSKVTQSHKWRNVSKFNMQLVKDQSDYKDCLADCLSCDLIGLDIETVKEPHPAITMISYTCAWVRFGVTKTYVLPIEDIMSVQWMINLNATNTSKVMQNGKYDIAYCSMYGAPVIGYMHDTINAMHSWYCELPRDLGSVASLFIRNSMYWKDLATVGDKQDQFTYCGLDTWSTVEAYMSWLIAAPDWAKKNYVMEFSVVPACHMCEMTGLKYDLDELDRQADKAEQELTELLSVIQRRIGVPTFNPSSPKQCLALLKILGEKDATSSKESVMQAVMYKHPLNELILESILEYRGIRKDATTYLVRKDFKGRLLYALNPHGTDTGRLASREHHLWCGLQIQNINKQSDFRKAVIADEGFEIWEADYSQAEDRGVAYKSGDAALLDVFASGKDSHSYKAAMFFGMDYSDIYDEVNKMVLNKEIRQLGKKVNHGANYNMGANVLVETMGPKNLRRAQALLKLPPDWTLKGIATFLLLAYEKAFPTVKTKYYASIKAQVRSTGKLVSDTGHTRYCFGDISNKQVLNAYVAHVTQNLNAMILNKAFLKVFWLLGFDPNFKLIAQIHDSILFQVRKGYEHLAEEVKRLMTFAVPVTDCSGITRDLIVPVDLERKGATWAGDK